MSLSRDEANRIIEATISQAREINIKVSVAVCDAGGRLLAFQRMDGAIWAGVAGSQGKAVTSSAFGRPSGDIAGRADHPGIRGILAAENGRMIPLQGAVPILRDGIVVGACGVGGGTSEQDEECARAGVAVL